MAGAEVVLQARRGGGPWATSGRAPSRAAAATRRPGSRSRAARPLTLRWAYLGGSFRRWLPTHSRTRTVVAP